MQSGGFYFVLNFKKVNNYLLFCHAVGNGIYCFARVMLVVIV